jgi:hypothetical protein
MMVYIWARRNPWGRMNFLGVFNFTAPYLPYDLMAPLTLSPFHSSLSLSHTFFLLLPSSGAVVANA